MDKTSKYGPFLVDGKNHSVQNNGSEVDLETIPFRMFQFFVEHVDQRFTTDQLLAEFWPERNAGPSSVSTAIYKIRKMLAQDADLLEIKPKAGWRLRPWEEKNPNISTDSCSANMVPDALGDTNRASRFVLSMDGIILNLVGELIFERASEGTIAECNTSYERALEDFAFAVVYGSQLRARWDPHNELNKREAEPAELLIKPLGHLYEREVLDQDLYYQPLLRDEAHRDAVRNYIRAMGYCMQQPYFVKWCRNLFVRESASLLGTHSSLFRRAKNPSDYRFGKEYYQDSLLDEIPGLLGSANLATLVRFVPKRPPEERNRKAAHQYADEARMRFVLEIVLTHITTMYQYEKYAERSLRWRVPYGLRAEITRASSQTQAQHRLRRILLSHALEFAVRKVSVSESRIAVVEMLLTMRTIPAFQEIREMLEELGIVLIKSDYDAERRAEKFIQEIYRLGESRDGPTDPFSLARSSVLRELAKTDPDDHRSRLYELFPQLALGKGRTGHSNENSRSGSRLSVPAERWLVA